MDMIELALGLATAVVGLITALVKLIQAVLKSAEEKDDR